MRFSLLTLFVAPFVIAGVVVGVAVAPSNVGLDGLQRRCSAPGEYCNSGESCCPGSRCLADPPNTGVDRLVDLAGAYFGCRNRVE
ncbi:hypothetical protein EDD15DRAFT_2257609 [Pisolithus albus]|nr:hypothetical protein EDD15DRAFT_2257609 [Pisolithus albus]